MLPLMRSRAQPYEPLPHSVQNVDPQDLTDLGLATEPRAPSKAQTQTSLNMVVSSTAEYTCRSGVDGEEPGQKSALLPGRSTAIIGSCWYTLRSCC